MAATVADPRDGTTTVTAASGSGGIGYTSTYTSTYLGDATTAASTPAVTQPAMSSAGVT